MPHVAVVVLGDVGRSPRMQYHCTSLATLPDTTVSLVGFGGERCIDGVEEAPRITKRLLHAPFARAPRALFLLWAPLKVLVQVAQLLWVLCIAMPPPTAILVQNPPSIPALAAVWLACRLRGARMVIDWHNFGYTVLAHSMGRRHPLVAAAYAYEALLSRVADAHLCVTDAMRRWLAEHWGVRATVLYDRPPPFFRPTPLQERHELFTRLRAALPPPPTDDDTLFTAASRTRGGAPALRPDRPALIVSSTSWTPDEDFGLLLDALVRLDAAAVAAPDDLPSFVVVVTGKGPQRAAYEARIAALALRRVAIRTLWLAPGDYPRLLGAADVGVCLHVSTSGLDLPMKVVDMFGAGLPVCAVDYACLHELVRDGVNGVTFRDAHGLAAHLVALFRGFPFTRRTAAAAGDATTGATPSLATLRAGVEDFQRSRWHDNWMANVAPLFAP